MFAVSRPAPAGAYWTLDSEIKDLSVLAAYARPLSGAVAVGSGIFLIRKSLTERNRRVRPVLDRTVISVPLGINRVDLSMELSPGFEQAKQLENFFEAAHGKGAEKARVVVGKERWRGDLAPGSFGKRAESARQWISLWNPARLSDDAVKNYQVAVRLKGLGKVKEIPSFRRPLYKFGGVGLAAAGAALVISWASSESALAGPRDERRENLLAEIEFLKRAIEEVTVHYAKGAWYVLSGNSFRLSLNKKDRNIFKKIAAENSFEFIPLGDEIALNPEPAYALFRHKFYERLKEAAVLYPADKAFKKLAIWGWETQVDPRPKGPIRPERIIEDANYRALSFQW